MALEEHWEHQNLVSLAGAEWKNPSQPGGSGDRLLPDARLIYFPLFLSFS